MHKKITFSDCYKKFTTDQDKAIMPEETLAKFYNKINAMDLDILNEVKRIDTGRLDIPVYFSVCGQDAKELTGTKKQMGKGASPIQAEASACMELVERYAFFAYVNNNDNFMVGDYSTMKENGYPVLSLSFLLKSVEDVTTSPEHLEEILKDIPMQWTWATNITKDEEVLIPFSWFFAINEFNGPSAGNTLEEAALQGICEIVERHVCSVVSRQKIETPKIDIQSISDPVAVELVEKFKNNSIDLYLHDFSLNTGICTVAALAIDRNTFPERSEIVYTAGTTPGPQKAIIRAVTEVAQLAGDFDTDSNYIASGLPKPLAMEEVEYLTNSRKSVTVQEMFDLTEDNFKDEVNNCVKALKTIDYEVFIIDTTNEELDIPTLYTIIPGAHFRERSISQSAGLFATKLAVEKIEDLEKLDGKLNDIEALLPNSYFLEFYRGKILYSQGNSEEAIKHFDEALQNAPENEDLPYIYSYKGHCLQMIGEFDLAIATLEKGRIEDDERPDIHNLLGVCFYNKNDYTTAIEHFERAVKLDPASAMDYANLGVNHSRLGNVEQAMQYLTLALTLDPSLDFVKNEMDKLI